MHKNRIRSGWGIIGIRGTIYALASATLLVTYGEPVEGRFFRRIFHSRPRISQRFHHHRPLFRRQLFGRRFLFKRFSLRRRQFNGFPLVRVFSTHHALHITPHHGFIPHHGHHFSHHDTIPAALPVSLGRGRPVDYGYQGPNPSLRNENYAPGPNYGDHFSSSPTFRLDVDANSTSISKSPLRNAIEIAQTGQLVSKEVEAHFPKFRPKSEPARKLGVPADPFLRRQTRRPLREYCSPAACTDYRVNPNTTCWIPPASKWPREQIERVNQITAKYVQSLDDFTLHRMGESAASNALEILFRTQSEAIVKYEGDTNQCLSTQGLCREAQKKGLKVEEIDFPYVCNEAAVGSVVKTVTNITGLYDPDFGVIK